MHATRVFATPFFKFHLPTAKPQLSYAASKIRLLEKDSEHPL